MESCKNDFGVFDGRIWLNSASQGPLPYAAVEAAKEAMDWKIRPYQLTFKRFREVPAQLKTAFARLVHVPAEEVVLGNSATYGIQLLSEGLAFSPGDEIVTMQNDFPVNILAWLGLARKGVKVLQVPPQGAVLTPEELLSNLTERTRLVCLSHVHSFSGHSLDIDAIGKICRKKGIIFVANITQSVGNMPLDLSRWPVDAVTTCGFKWLLGPYGTGLCWMSPALRNQLSSATAFWANRLSPEDLDGTGPLSLLPAASASAYDVPGTANFLNFFPLTASINYLLGIGMENVHNHIQTLVARFIHGLDDERYVLISPGVRERPSALVVFSHRDRKRNKTIFDALLHNGIYGAFWKGNIRIAPHIFNGPDEIDAVLELLHSDKLERG